MSPSKPPEAQRIAKLLARAGIASRRDIERMIAQGRIALDGKVLETPATILTSLAGVTVDGEPVKAAEAARLFRFHKPSGVLTAERDFSGRPTIYDRLPKGLPRLMPVGRLDLNTEGLLLLTTDGELKRQLELPSTGVERTYRARAYGDVSQEQLEELMLGIEIDGIRYGSINANLERRTGANVWIEMTLKEGKNREVRRVLEHLGLRVSRLIRTSYGPFVLEDMPVGAVDEIHKHDLILFRRAMDKGDIPTHASGVAIRTVRTKTPRGIERAEEVEAAEVAEDRPAPAPRPVRARADTAPQKAAGPGKFGARQAKAIRDRAARLQAEGNEGRPQRGDNWREQAREPRSGGDARQAQRAPRGEGRSAAAPGRRSHSEEGARPPRGEGRGGPAQGYRSGSNERSSARPPRGEGRGGTAQGYRSGGDERKASRGDAGAGPRARTGPGGAPRPLRGDISAAPAGAAARTSRQKPKAGWAKPKTRPDKPGRKPPRK